MKNSAVVRIGRLLGALALCFVIGAPAVLAAEVEIVSAGPLTRIITSDTLACQVAHRDDELFEFFPATSTTGSCGTFLAAGGVVYGPLGGNPTQIPWTVGSQSPVTGQGSSGDPFRLMTVVSAPEIGVQVTQTDSYVVGSQSYRTDILLTNSGAEPRTGILYRGGDCFLQGSDSGFARVDGAAPACIVDPALGRRIEQWTPITPGSHFFAGDYGEVWSIIASQQHFPDRCECEETIPFDNGAGVSWSVSLAPGGTATIAHETFFSPVGRGPIQQPFRESVPDPTRISLDPVIVAQSVAIAAGVILLVPFPSALFNSTLEENYEEVMAGVARVRSRVRGWLSRAWAALRAWVARQAAARRPAAAPPIERAPHAATTPALEPPAKSIAQPIIPSAPGRPVPPVVLPAAQPAPPEPIVAAPPVTGEPAHGFWHTPYGMLAFIALSALLYAFLDPTFGFNIVSLATFAGLAIGLFVVVLAYGVPLFVIAQNRGLSISARALPTTLVIAVACVLISRLANFQPGYLYGLIIGFFFASAVDRREEGRAEAIAAACSLGAAFVAWMLLAVLRSTDAVAGELTTPLLEAATVTVVVAGLENAVFAMLPLRFLPGSVVYPWNRKVWAVLIGLGIFGFAHVLLNPSAGYMGDTTRTPFVTMLVLLIGFGVASILFWAYFRFRRQPAAAG